MSRNKTIILLTMIFSLSFQAFDAAARVGGGRPSSSMSSSRSSISRVDVQPQRAGSGANIGMQRPDVMNKVRNGEPSGASPLSSSQPVGTTSTPMSSQPARPGYGIGTVVGAAAAGAAVGYIANSAMHENSPLQNQSVAKGGTDNYGDPLAAGRQASGTPSSPWGGILLFLAGTAAIIGTLMFLSRRREAANPVSLSNLPASAVQSRSGSSEQQAFEREALKFFNELQSANNRGDTVYMEQNSVDPIRSILVEDINKRTSPSNTQVLMMNANLVDMTEEPGRRIASVLFQGTVSENENAAPERIQEVWHLVKDNSDDAKWLLAGIEQVMADDAV